MAKDTTKNLYLNIGLARDSWVLQRLKADADFHQMGDLPAKMASVRLVEYYRLVEMGIITPGITVLGLGRDAALSQTAETERTPKRKAGGESITDASTEKGNEFLGESAAIGTNADALLGFFGEDE
jgi:hypothetical protein